ncbi:helix-turn-helix transcriptional regulator, partial [bacterium]|nr:helix-turn-helix transcriptional regulator [bacterium]
LQELARQLNGEVIARQPKSTPIAASSTSLHQRTVELISRRPCTVTDLCSALGATPAAITTLLQELESSGKLLQERQQRGIFYRWQGDRAGNASITGGTRGKM